MFNLLILFSGRMYISIKLNISNDILESTELHIIIIY